MQHEWTNPNFVNVESLDDKMTPYSLAIVGGLFALADMLLKWGFATKD